MKKRRSRRHTRAPWQKIAYCLVLFLGAFSFTLFFCQKQRMPFVLGLPGDFVFFTLAVAAGGDGHPVRTQPAPARLGPPPRARMPKGHRKTAMVRENGGGRSAQANPNDATRAWRGHRQKRLADNGIQLPARTAIESQGALAPRGPRPPDKACGGRTKTNSKHTHPSQMRSAPRPSFEASAASVPRENSPENGPIHRGMLFRENLRR